ncbi:S-methyl-5-thioribose-1-phosphate isomerase [Rhodovarius lipocyclicus]|uniref:S-methyl-5-thioribose-1-phosphate isomerase n=1 Tax=Rhodovarius lipocyclicus TaxID=268410 RepID=UPI00135C0422|nr:S-methyl-5-thioribose-1-phosphate isomerase [Rhodovarius lipocyclicus]
MKINGTYYRSLWLDDDGWSLRILDQTLLPWRVEVLRLSSAEQVGHAITSMQVRGAPLIGAVAAYGVAIAMRTAPQDLDRVVAWLGETRPTAINLRWALARLHARLAPLPVAERAAAAYAEAAAIADDDAETCRLIGQHGLPLLREIAARKGRVNILTHCNAGWLATVDYGTALSPIYQAHDAGLDVHVWVDETRPRNQGAALTAFELGAHGVPHTVIADNAGGHYMQHGEVDICIVGTDRVTRRGDVANKIGTYLKALAARDNGVPFWVALPHSTLDMQVDDGVKEIPIEERSAAEVTHLTGPDEAGRLTRIQVTAPGSKAANPAFDVTPARLVTGLITERGRCEASAAGLAALYPEKAA